MARMGNPAWVPGVSGNPKGRPKGTVGGRHKALIELDKFLAEAETIEALHEGWRKGVKANPLGFWVKVVVPLLPKNIALDIMGGEEAVRGVYRAVVEVLSDERGGNGGGNGDDPADA